MKPKWYDIKAKSEQTTTVYIYEEIGEDWFGEGLTAKAFVKDFAAISTPQIELRVNSPGGSVFDAHAIYNAIERHPANVTAYVDGMALSAASFIVQAADERVMAANALMMIHSAWGISMGNARDMREMADILEKTDGTIVGIYAERSGRSEDEMRALMEAETWMTAAEAVEAGLADEVGGEMKVAASFDLSRFKHPPRASAPEDEAEPVVPDAAPEPEPVPDGDEPEPESVHYTYPLPPL